MTRNRKTSKEIFQSNIKASDPAYINIRAAKSEPAQNARKYVEDLWSIYEPYADQNFAQEISIAFDQRFWEMYLTCALIDIGLPVKCPKPGPDILVEINHKKIWIEATACTQGRSDNPDRVPDYQTGFSMATRVPEEKILLRISSALKDKYEDYNEYREKGTVSEDDAYIIAVNTWQIPNAAWVNRDPPLIAKAVFPIGPLQITFDRKSFEEVSRGFEHRPFIKRSNDVKIETDISLNDKFSDLSGVLHSNANAGNPTNDFGSDFILIHNPLANNPIPQKLFGRGKEFSAIPDGDGSYTLHDLIVPFPG